MSPSDSLGLPLFWSSVWLVFKVGIIIFTALYFIFSLIVIRQISLMTETVTTAIASGLKAVGILFALVSLGLLIFLVTLLF